MGPQLREQGSMIFCWRQWVGTVRAAWARGTILLPPTTASFLCNIIACSFRRTGSYVPVLQSWCFTNHVGCASDLFCSQHSQSHRTEFWSGLVAWSGVACLRCQDLCYSLNIVFTYSTLCIKSCCILIINYNHYWYNNNIIIVIININ